MRDDLLLVEDSSDVAKARQIAETLDKHYRGYLWAVNVDQGIATVRALALSGKWGFVVKLNESWSSSDLDHRVVIAGGEILERFRMPRGKFNQKAYEGLETDSVGDFLKDL